MSAAIVNKTFLDLLLANPGRALREGLCGQGFELSAEEQQLIASIEANSLLEFAEQLVECRNGTQLTNHHGSGHINGHTNRNGKLHKNGYHR